MESFDLPMLPHAALRRVLAFAADADRFGLHRHAALVDCYADDFVPCAPSLPASVCDALASSSPAWVQPLEELHAETNALHLSVHLHKKPWEDALSPSVSNQVERLCRAIDKRSTTLRSLSIRSSHDLNDTEINWANIIEAASTLCLDLEALELPPNHSPTEYVSFQMQKTMTALYSALQKWYERGRRGGLRQLTVPQRYAHGFYPGEQEEDDTVIDEDEEWSQSEAMARDTDAFLRAVAEYCPNIEYLDGTDATYREEDSLAQAHEIWYGSKAAWEFFCRRCTKLRQLNWYAVPYVDGFFEVFAQYPKPWLTRLTMATISFNKRKFSDEDVNGDIHGAYYREGEWTCSSAGLALVPTACPSLEVLRIRFSQETDEATRVRRHFADAFLVAVAQHCKQLQEFQMDEISDDSVLVDGITDVGVSALASLESLWSIRLLASNCRHDGVFAIMAHAPRYGRVREACLNFWYDDDDDIDFPKMVLQLFDLVVSRASELIGRRFHITLADGRDSITSEWEGLLARIKEVRHVLPEVEISLFDHAERRIETSTSCTTRSRPAVPPFFVMIRSSRQHRTVSENEVTAFGDADQWPRWEEVQMKTDPRSHDQDSEGECTAVWW